MHNRIFILSLIFIFNAGLFAGDTGGQKKSNGKSAVAGKTNTSGNLKIEGAAAEGISFLNANGDTLMQVREDGQVIIGAAVANGNAVLDVDAFNNDKGIMLPRLTRDERFAMSLTPADEGLLIYDETSSRFWYWKGSQWEVVGNNVGDNLGDHTVREALNLNGFYLSGDGDSEGLSIDSDGNVGIGTQHPSNKLSVAGSVNFNGDADFSGNANFGGNVGIGTATPTERFHVNAGDILISRTGSVSTGAALTIEGRRRNKNGPIASLDFKNSDADDSDMTYTAAAIRSYNNGESDDGDLRLFTAADSILAERMRITDDGNVGIGTTSPGSELEVAGTVTATSFAGDGSGLTGIAGDNLGTHTASQALDLANNNVVNGDTITANVFLGDGSGLTGIAGDNLGTHTATQSINLNGNYLSGDGSSEGLFVDSSGLAGIGTATPFAGLDIGIFGKEGLTRNALRLPTTGGQTHIRFGRLGTLADESFVISRNWYRPSGFAADDNNFGAQQISFREDGTLAFNTGSAGSGPATRLHISPDGNVGIGNTAPATILDVSGTITATAFVGDGSGLTNINGWQLTGNAGTGASNFIGTTDNQPLIFKVNNKTILRLHSHSISPNVIGGYSGNSVGTNVRGVTISGGGDSDSVNAVTASYGTVSGGRGNQVSGSVATVGGGRENTASSPGATIGGGLKNNATGYDATISGGIENTASNTGAAVGGGFSNHASGYQSVIGGGQENIADGARSTIGGGDQNTTSGENATVPGGYKNTAAGEGSFAAGQRAQIADTHDGTFLFSDQSDVDFNSAAANEFAVRATGGVRFVTAIDGAGNPTKTVRIDSAGTSIALTEGTQTASLKTSESNGYVQLDVGGPGHTSDKIYIGDLTNNNNEVIMMGDVGIGITNPANKLSVSGSANFSGDVGIGITNPANKLSVSGSANFSGNVGIGTSAPGERLHIKSSGSNDAKICIEGDANDAPMIEFRDNVSNVGFIGWDDSNNVFKVKAGDNFSNSDGISIDLDGNVGIGTNTPSRAKVHITGSQQHTFSSYGYLNSAGLTGVETNRTADYSLYASHRIAGSGFNAFSDARIKNIRGRSDNAQDLSTLLAIEITDYTMIDSIAKGSQSQKKVIAQQVKEIFPQAVSTMTDVVPDIYQLSEIADGWVQLATDLQVGEKVKLIRKDGSDIYAVQAVRDGAFRVDLAENGEVFVYGREVDDFHTVDYEAIAMLNVSATQALYQRMQQQQAEMNAQKKTMHAQQKTIEALTKKVARIDTLERQLAAIMEQLAPVNAVRNATITEKNDAQ